ncbi:hypothetical protein GIY23_22095 [Allosaccharopolyspora coralli]|uniref:Uncharacterized protein n=1 Tax=Allosaccharopolyspora coralli TaxID=2665642 RepID=A0A5Q3QBA0_9PSEU|nr:hypothetical protein [Allosaccharopolyspora coralli]QGK71838.1 hypothetical protein GIY23_22095 [Allosaccharopolyspora coralli]
MAMEPGMGSYITFLIVGVALVFIDGRLIQRSGRTYLEEVYPDKDVADSVNRLVTVLFHFSVLGILALISTIDLTRDTALETVVARTGVMLLILAVAHGVTIWVLVRIRNRQRQQRMQEELVARNEARMNGHEETDDIVERGT